MKPWQARAFYDSGDDVEGAKSATIQLSNLSLLTGIVINTIIISIGVHTPHTHNHVHMQHAHNTQTHLQSID